MCCVLFVTRALIHFPPYGLCAILCTSSRLKRADALVGPSRSGWQVQVAPRGQGRPRRARSDTRGPRRSRRGSVPRELLNETLNAARWSLLTCWLVTPPWAAPRHSAAPRWPLKSGLPGCTASHGSSLRGKRSVARCGPCARLKAHNLNDRVIFC